MQSADTLSRFDWLQENSDFQFAPELTAAPFFSDVYLKGSRVKVEVALAKGKKLYDKREDAAKKDAKRQIDRVMKERNIR